MKVADLLKVLNRKINVVFIDRFTGKEIVTKEFNAKKENERMLSRREFLDKNIYMIFPAKDGNGFIVSLY